MAERPRVIILKSNDNYHSENNKLQLHLIKDIWNVVNKVLPTTLNDEWMLNDGKANATIGPLVGDNQLEYMYLHYD